MDQSNLEDLEEMAPRNSKANVQLFGEYRTDKQFPRTVSDPYYGGIRGFEMSFQQLSHFTDVFLDKVVQNS
jgi:low molecular weight phosphotyrosine protein phosphatase